MRRETWGGDGKEGRGRQTGRVEKVEQKVEEKSEALEFKRKSRRGSGELSEFSCS